VLEGDRLRIGALTRHAETPFDPSDVDEQVGRVEAQVQRRQQALAARKEARLTFAAR
jgi:hypothetical protein